VSCVDRRAPARQLVISRPAPSSSHRIRERARHLAQCRPEAIRAPFGPRLAGAQLRQRQRLGRGGSGFRRGLGLACDRQIIPEANSAPAAQNDRPTLGRADDFEPTPCATGVADATAASGAFYLGHVLRIHQLPIYHIAAAPERPLNATGDERTVALTLSRGDRVRTRSQVG